MPAICGFVTKAAKKKCDVTIDFWAANLYSLRNVPTPPLEEAGRMPGDSPHTLRGIHASDARAAVAATSASDDGTVWPVPATPTTPKGLRTRATILKAARRIFARDGYVAARMSDVAIEAELSLGAIYRYFENKESLFAQLIGDIHEALYSSSRSHSHRLEDDPYGALLESNTGYLAHYFEHRDIMRALVEAATVDRRFRDQWWTMRKRHVCRFASAAEALSARSSSGSLNLELATDAMACMVEQAAYVWYAQDELATSTVPIEEAAATLTWVWYRTFFGEDTDPERILRQHSTTDNTD